MHRLFTATAIIVSTVLISLSADAGAGGGPHVRVFSGKGSAAADDGHKDWINLNRIATVRWAPGVESRNVKLRGKARPRHGTLTVHKAIDKATPLLARAAKTRRPLPEVVLTARNTDPRTARSEPYLRYKLKNVRVTSYQTSGSADDVPMEEFSLNYEEIK